MSVSELLALLQDDVVSAVDQAAAPLSEVAENDYNLNIPRYVETFEGEEPIDLMAVTNALQGQEEAMAETDVTISGFIQELGIPSPFNS